MLDLTPNSLTMGSQQANFNNHKTILHVRCIMFKYDIGRSPSVVALADGTLIETHTSNFPDSILYSIGTPSTKDNTIHWGKSHKYGYGFSPKLALIDQETLIEVHSIDKSTSDEPPNYVTYYRIGKILFHDGLSLPSIAWGKDYAHKEGFHPAIAALDTKTVMLVDRTSIWSRQGKLNYSIGTIAHNSNNALDYSIQWGPCCYYADGMSPTITTIDHKTVVEMHSEIVPGIKNPTVLCRIGKLGGANQIEWKASTNCGVGVFSAPIATGPNMLVEAQGFRNYSCCHSSCRFQVKMGHIVGDSVVWDGPISEYKGILPAIAAIPGKFVVLSEVSGSFCLVKELWCGTITYNIPQYVPYLPATAAATTTLAPSLSHRPAFFAQPAPSSQELPSETTTCTAQVSTAPK